MKEFKIVVFTDGETKFSEFDAECLLDENDIAINNWIYFNGENYLILDVEIRLNMLYIHLEEEISC